jgi:hypothetical protein
VFDIMAIPEQAAADLDNAIGQRTARGAGLARNTKRVMEIGK